VYFYAPQIKLMYRLIFLLLLAAGYANGQTTANFTSDASKAYRLILSLRFDEAGKKIATARASDPENALYDYLENYQDFLSTFISENDETFSSQMNNKNRRLESFEKISDQSPYKNYLIANVNLQSAVARLKFGEYYTAALEFNRAYRKINENAQKFPEFFPNQITLGVVHAMIGVVPENYQWLLNLVSMSGSVEQGRQELIKALAQCHATPGFEVMENEILFYLSFINLNLYSDIETVKLPGEPDNNNLLIKYLSINILMKEGKNDQALAIFSEINDTIPYYPFHYLNYLHGECYLRRGNYQEAYQKYQQFIGHFKGKNYLKDAVRKQAWCMLLQGEAKKYTEKMAMVENIGYTNVGIDNEAETEAENRLIPNPTLLKSRLLFDGGYYSEATNQLEKLAPERLKLEEQVEKQYRLARIAQKTGETEKARAAYIKTIEMGKNLDLYYAANSALLLGNIYEDAGEKELAMDMYRQCLSFDFHTYRGSIRGLAKQHLSRLE